MNAPNSFLPPIPPDHAQALQRVAELEAELQALRNLVIVADVALESVELELRSVAPTVALAGAGSFNSAMHELGATRRSLAVVR